MSRLGLSPSGHELLGSFLLVPRLRPTCMGYAEVDFDFVGIESATQHIESWEYCFQTLEY